MSAAVATSSPPVDLSGDGGVTREMLKEGSGKGLATGDIATVRFTGTVAETGQVRRRRFGAGNGIFGKQWAVC